MRPAVAIARLQPTNAAGTLSTTLAFSKISVAWTASIWHMAIVKQF